MIWLFVVLALGIAVVLGVWWLERPLWYKCEGVRSLENFLRDLMSPRHPYPHMYVVAGQDRCQLHFSRARADDGAFHIDLAVSFKGSEDELARSVVTKLQASHFSRDQISIASESNGSLNLRVDFGRNDGSTLSEATQASRIILEQLGVGDHEVLRVRCSGPMDPAVAVPALQNVERRAGPLMRFAARIGLKRFDRS